MMKGRLKAVIKSCLKAGSDGLFAPDIHQATGAASVSENSAMDALLNPLSGDYVTNESAHSIENELYIRLVTPRGSYWADTALGSRLHELRRQKHLPRMAVLARQYAEQALQPLLESGRAQSITVTASSPRAGWLKLAVEAVDAGGSRVTLNYQVAVA